MTRHPVRRGHPGSAISNCSTPTARRARGAAARVAEVPRQRRRRRSTATSRDVARARGHAPVGTRVAVRVPRGGDPRDRRPPRVHDRQVVVHRDPHRPPTRSRPTPTHACTAAASSRTTTVGAPSSAARSTASRGRSTASSATCPAKWDFDHVPAPRSSRCPECKVGTWAGFVFINPDPDAEPLARLPRRDRRPVRRVGSRQPLQAGPRRQGHRPQLEDRPGGVLRGAPRGRHPPAGHALPRRHQQPGRHLGELRAGDHPRRHVRARCSTGRRRRTR